MSVDDLLKELADLIREKNIVDGRIAAITGRPTQLGHVGDYIASQVFDIELHVDARKKGSDGRFLSGRLQNRSVNVKWYPKQEGGLDINPDHVPDYFLVLTGPIAPAVSSRGQTRPWIIEHVFLFEVPPLIEDLEAHQVQIKKDAPTGIRAELWVWAEIYPTQTNTILMVSEEQRRRLQFFLGSPDADKNRGLR